MRLHIVGIAASVGIGHRHDRGTYLVARRSPVVFFTQHIDASPHTVDTLFGRQSLNTNQRQCSLHRGGRSAAWREARVPCLTAGRSAP
jgi:hypothetical protein